MDFTPYDLTHVLTQLQLLFFAMLAFVWLYRSGLYPPEVRAINVDAEWFYRRFFPNLIGSIMNWLWRSDAAIRASFMTRLNGLFSYLVQLHYPGGKVSRLRPTGNMVMWVAVLLAVYMWLLLSFAI
jgi:multicomponent Na+:H+ antiporter subunit D